MSKRTTQLAVLPHVKTVTYHRNPTPAEIRFGHGATHWRDFPVEACTWPGRFLKRWFVAYDDGLRYYR